MICVKCSSDTKVINSRPHRKTPTVWRRRQCKACNTTFTTNEAIADEKYPLVVVNSAGKKTQFSLPVLMVSFFQVFAHHEVPIASEESYWLAQTVAQDIQGSATDSISTTNLAHAAYGTLLRYDEIAATQYGVRHGVVSLSKSQKKRPGRPRSR